MTVAPVTAVRFGRLERRGVLLGLSAGQLSVLAAGLIVVVTAEYIAGVVGVVVSAPVWVALVSVALLVVSGRPLVAWLPCSTRGMVRGVWKPPTRRGTSATPWWGLSPLAGAESRYDN